MMSEWIRYEDGAELESGTYFCAYGTGPYIGMFDYDDETQEMKPKTDRLQILEWRSAPRNPFDHVKISENTEWADYESEVPLKSGKYMCRYLHNYRMGELRYDADEGWEGGYIVTHYMEID